MLSVCTYLTYSQWGTFQKRVMKVIERGKQANHVQQLIDGKGTLITDEKSCMDLIKQSGLKGKYALVKGVAKPAVSIFQSSVSSGQMLYRQNMYSLLLPLKWAWCRAILPKSNMDAEAQNYLLHVSNGETITIYPTQKTSMHGFENRTTITVPHLSKSNQHLYYPTLGLAFF
jgi:hypothetical protein